MEKIAVFIDGGYLNKVLEYDHAKARIDYEKLVSLLVGPHHLLRAYYYNCLPYQSDPPTEEEKIKFAAAQRFQTKLNELDKFEIREGRLEYRGLTSTGKKIFVQKRVDIALACDIVQLSTKGKISKAIVITGDSDFIPAIKIAKQEGVEIILAHSNANCKPHNDLWTIADIRIPIDTKMIGSILKTT